MPDQHIEFEIQIVDCSTNTISVPAAIADVVKIYDGNAFPTDEIASLAGFASSLSHCPIEHYIVTCTDKDDKKRSIRRQKTTVNTWALEELTA